MWLSLIVCVQLLVTRCFDLVVLVVVIVFYRLYPTTAQVCCTMMLLIIFSMKSPYGFQSSWGYLLFFNVVIFKSSCSSGRFSVNIFSLDYLLPTYTSFTNTLLTPLIFSAEVLANVEQHRSWEQQHNHLPHPHRHRGALHGSRRPEPNSATSSTCSDPSGRVQNFLPCFCPEIISSHNFAVVNNKHPESGWFCAGREALLADFHVSAFLPRSDPHLFADSQKGKS